MLRPPDGSLLDVTLLAAVAALSSLRLPAVRVNEDGNVVPAGDADEPEADGMAEHDARDTADRYALVSDASDCCSECL